MHTRDVQAFLVAFKLESDALVLSERAHISMERHGLHMVVGNAVRTRGRHVLLVTEREEVNLVSSRERDLEPAMVAAVVRAHKQFRLEREALRSSRRLLGLTAKFTMFREGEDVVDEDALGNRNVPFCVGVRIKANRRAADSPVYELVQVYHNKSRSARCLLWKRVMGSGGGDGGGQEVGSTSTTRGEVLVTFSPAGNPGGLELCERRGFCVESTARVCIPSNLHPHPHPHWHPPLATETILRLWGDTWKGWLEEEVKSLVEAAKHIPASTYLRILASPLTGDFTDAALLLERVARSLSQAWQHREKTQFIQALGNLLNIGWVWGLSAFLPWVSPCLDRRVGFIHRTATPPGSTGA